MYVEFDVYFVLYVILTIMVYLGKSLCTSNVWGRCGSKYWWFGSKMLDLDATAIRPCCRRYQDLWSKVKSAGTRNWILF